MYCNDMQKKFLAITGIWLIFPTHHCILAQRICPLHLGIRFMTTRKKCWQNRKGHITSTWKKERSESDNVLPSPWRTAYREILSLAE
jgi:hypothetical protein